MSSIQLKHSGGNSVIIAAPSSNPASNRTLTLPSNADGTILTTTNPKAGNIIQVKQAVKTDTASTSSATFADVSGLSISITPSSTSNKILVECFVVTGGQQDGFLAFKVLRDSTAIGIGTAGTANQTNASFSTAFGNASTHQFAVKPAAWSFLDSPSSTSSLTYKVQWASTYLSRTMYVNRPYTSADSSYAAITISTITVKEVAA